MKIIDNGLNLYPVKSLSGVKTRVDNIELPPIYASFLNVFQVGKRQNMLAQVYLDERYNEKLDITQQCYTYQSAVLLNTIKQKDQLNSQLVFLFNSK